MKDTIRRLFLITVLASCMVVLGSLRQIAFAENKCSECHEEAVKSFESGHHNAAWNLVEGGSKHSCEACHGSTEEHIKNGGGKESIISFSKGSKQTAQERSKQCLSCHSTSNKVAFWKMGKHSKNDVDCASCHNMHGGKAAVIPKPETCFGCHKDIKALVGKSSHHPIKEGKVTCADCHNPHGSLSHGNLAAENVNQTCYKCHADKRGPYLWEHAPVEENCATCHNPHGSNHENLLVQKLPNLCQNCHEGRHPSTAYTATNGFGVSAPSTRLVSKACANCHGNIHGSNAPKNPKEIPVSGSSNQGQGYNGGKYLTH
ncbi:MAG: DmsE family decaheme c-type cytochrome [Bdellovibrionota bacterium]